MNAFLLALERASMWGLGALIVALGVQWVLDGRVPASWRVWIWRVALLQTTLALIPPAALRLAVLPAQQSGVVSTRPSVAAFVSPQNEIPIALPSASFTPLKEAAPLWTQVAAPSTRPNWIQAILFIYALGLGANAVLLANRFVQVRRLLHACQLVEAAKTSAPLREIARRMQVAMLPRLLSSQASAPCLVGIWRPKIVLPHSLLISQQPDLETTLSHELAHLKRRDLFWNAVLWPIQTLFWFHPLVWCARWFLALETESACDEMVLSSTRVAPKFYGALILNTMNNPTTPFTAGITDGFFALKKRLTRLNQTPKRPRCAFRVAFVVALCLALSASIPLRLVARAQDQPQSSVAKRKSIAAAKSYRVTRRIPQNNTPEVEVGLPATSKEAFARANTTISGRVVYENGKPAAGIRVMAFCHWNAQTELWGYHRNQANHYRWPDKIDKLLSGTTTTRADGTYRFAGLLPQRYSIHLAGDNLGNRAPSGWMAPYRGVHVTTVAKKTRRAPDTILRRSAQIRIQAVDQDTGVPLEGVSWRGFNLDEGKNPTGWAVDAHQGDRPFKGHMSEGVTDQNGYCTLDLDSDKAYFFMTGGNYMGSTAFDKPVTRVKGLPDSFMTVQGRYRSAAWCEVKALTPLSEAKKPVRRAWKGETELPLQRGPAANFIVKLKRFRALRPDEQDMLASMKRHF